MKTLLALAAAAVAFTAAPADAKHYDKHHSRTVCTKGRHGQCVASHQLGLARAQQVHQRNVSRQTARLFAVGQRVPRAYGYWTPYSGLPQNYVTQYNLSPDNRYVYRNHYIYVVDPKTYAVERIITALTR